MSELLPSNNPKLQRLSDTWVQLNEVHSVKGAIHPETFAAINRHEGAILAYLDEVRRLREINAKKARPK